MAPLIKMSKKDYKINNTNTELYCMLQKMGKLYYFILIPGKDNFDRGGDHKTSELIMRGRSGSWLVGLHNNIHTHTCSVLSVFKNIYIFNLFLTRQVI